MPLDRSRIKKSAFLTGAAFPADGMFKKRRADDLALRRRYPEFSGVLDQAGLPPTDEKLEALARERRELEQRMAALLGEVAAVTVKRP